MARVTIDDCLLYVPNRFELVLKAANRARELSNGAKTTADVDKGVHHKPTVSALKEIAEGKTSISAEKTEEEVMDALFGELNKIDDHSDLFDDDIV
tara:strand:+ start:4894 stop:5181 length:288 start_codon:yes stop_codon:yes gene_type:complete